MAFLQLHHVFAASFNLFELVIDRLLLDVRRVLRSLRFAILIRSSLLKFGRHERDGVGALVRLSIDLISFALLWKQLRERLGLLLNG